MTRELQRSSAGDQPARQRKKQALDHSTRDVRTSGSVHDKPAQSDSSHLHDVDGRAPCIMIPDNQINGGVFLTVGEKKIKKKEEKERKEEKGETPIP